ncbi:MAG: hypothetical protein DYH17_14125 [Xanthomonadales bacterium PRO6]|nr:hypothetical protein [Xanthomonadales bacterium PRO6]
MPEARVTARPVGRRIYAFALTFVVLWLAWSLTQVRIEFDDGYTVIANAHYFLGDNPDYFWQRGPLLPLLLLPAAWVAQALALHPLDTWPYHTVVVALHAMYLVGCWRLLERYHGGGVGSGLAFLAALLTPVFFGYAAFISQDILPGLIGLLMVLLTAVFLVRPGWRVWLTLVGLGALVTLFKQTYAMFWAATLVAAFGASIRRGRRFPWTPLALLFAAAAASAVLAWLAYALSLSGSFQNTPQLLRPLVQSRAFLAYFQQEGPITEIIWQWVYLRNLHAHGIAAMVLVLPALVLALRHCDLLQRMVAIAWIALFAGMQLLAFKEVRYLAMLAPLTAFLLAPLLQRMWQERRACAVALCALLAVDLARGLAEASRLAHPFYREALIGFFADLPSPAQEFELVGTRHLSFLTPESYAFRGDRYHRILNLNVEQIRALYGYRSDQVRRFRDPSRLRMEMVAPGAWLLFANEVAARVPPLAADNRTTLTADFLQLLGVAETVELVRDAGSYRIQEAGAARWFMLPTRAGDAPRFFVRSMSEADLAGLLGRSPGDRERLTAFRVKAYCRLAGCTRSADAG